MPREYRILLVGDLSPVKGDLLGAFQAEGYSVVSATACHEAADHLKTAAYHLAVIGREMPDFEGHLLDAAGDELFLFIKEYYPYTSSVIVASQIDLESVKKTIRQGIFDYLVKPVEAAHLSEVVKKALTSRLVVANSRGGAAQSVDPLDFYDMRGVMRSAFAIDTTWPAIVELQSTYWEASTPSRLSVGRIELGTPVVAIGVSEGRVEVVPEDMADSYFNPPRP